MVIEIADKVWEFAELSLQEFKSAKTYCDALEAEGFEVERGTAGIETAFTASYGHGRPYIGVLAEYDALSGLSQEAGLTERKERCAGGNGHGCGHNLLGAGAFAAALGIKAYLEKNDISVRCSSMAVREKRVVPQKHLWQEMVYGKSWMWHLPGIRSDVNEVATGSSNSCIQVQYKFTGTTSHAAGAPEMGRSALDAVELMNIGVQFLREHMSDKARIHYAITDAGGCSPNVVQPRASVLYMVRSNHVAEAVELQKRVDKIAEGAALMTETTYERKFIDGLADTVSNFALERVLYRNFQELGVPVYRRRKCLCRYTGRHL